MLIMFVVCEENKDDSSSKRDGLIAMPFDSNKPEHMAALQIELSEYRSKFNTGGKLVTEINSDYKMLYIVYDETNIVGFFKFYYQQGNELSFYYIVLPMYAGRGYGTKIVGLIKREAGKIMPPHYRLVALVDCSNIASIKAIEKHGGIEMFVGHMREMKAVFIEIPVSKD
jgi:RimJ/RimL family protein N-acetyltransferase